MALNDNAKKWVVALRSGEYAQTRGTLHRTELRLADQAPPGYCCLGVACELFDRANPGVLRRETTRGRETFDEADEFLPFVVADWLGLGTHDGEFVKPQKLVGLPTSLATRSLARRNDAGATFAEIAEIIESEPEGLFA